MMHLTVISNRLLLIRFLPYLSIFLMTLMVGCSKWDVYQEMGNDRLSGKSGDDDPHSPNPCAGVISVKGTPFYSSGSLSGDYDLTIEYNMPDISPPRRCICSERFTEIKLEGDIAKIDWIIATTAKPLNNFSGLGQPGTIRTDTLFLAQKIAESIKIKDAYVLKIEDEMPKSIWIKYKSTSSNVIPQVRVKTIKGICLVDNIHDPHLH